MQITTAQIFHEKLIEKKGVNLKARYPQKS